MPLKQEDHTPSRVLEWLVSVDCPIINEKALQDYLDTLNKRSSLYHPNNAYSTNNYELIIRRNYAFFAELYYETAFMQ